MTEDILKQTLADTSSGLLDLKALIVEGADQDLLKDKIQELINDIDQTLEGRFE